MIGSADSKYSIALRE